MVKFDLTITATLLMSLFILIAGISTAMFLGSVEVALSTIVAVGGLLGIRSYSVNKTRRADITKENEEC